MYGLSAVVGIPVCGRDRMITVNAAGPGQAPRGRGRLALITDRNVATKILLAALIGTMLCAGAAVFAVVQMAGVNNGTQSVYRSGLQLETVAEMRHAYNRYRIAAIEHYLSSDATVKATQEQN